MELLGSLLVNLTLQLQGREGEGRGGEGVVLVLWITATNILEVMSYKCR